jgi:uncharacterized protein YtpQ (UPF0354 family)
VGCRTPNANCGLRDLEREARYNGLQMNAKILLCFVSLVGLSACARGAAPAAAAPTTAQTETCAPPAQRKLPFDARSRAAFEAWLNSELDNLVPCWTFSKIEGAELSFVGARGARRTDHSFESGWRHCQNVPEHCERQVRAALADTAHALETYDDPVSAELAQLRPVVRRREVAVAIAAQTPGAVVEPFAADLTLLLVVDNPATLAFVGQGHLDALGVTRTAAKERALSNLRAELADVLAEIQAIQPGSVGQLKPHYYTSSLIVLHDVWAECARRLDGQLYVAVPSPEVLFYGDLRDTAGLEKVRGLVREIHAAAPHPLSPTLLRFTERGWEDLSPRQ